MQFGIDFLKKGTNTLGENFKIKPTKEKKQLKYTELKSGQKSSVLPFGMLLREQETIDRSYEIYPETWNYDPNTQVTDLIKMVKTNPTTYSRIATTGLKWDTDEGSDDRGTD